MKSAVDMSAVRGGYGKPFYKSTLTRKQKNV